MLCITSHNPRKFKMSIAYIKIDVEFQRLRSFLIVEQLQSICLLVFEFCSFCFFFIPAGRSCPTGWEPFENACYKYFSEGQNKEAARSTCELAGAHHVDIQSSAENNFVKNLVPITIIGVTFGYKRDSSGNFVWDRTGGPGPYRNWNTGEPNNANGGEGCGVMYISEWHRAGKWNDVPCNAAFTFVCKKGETVLVIPRAFFYFQTAFMLIY